MAVIGKGSGEVKISFEIDLSRYLLWGDRRHWEATVGRTNVSRWCEGAPCSHDVIGRHRVTFRRWNRSWSAGDR